MSVEPPGLGTDLAGAGLERRLGPVELTRTLGRLTMSDSSAGGAAATLDGLSRGGGEAALGRLVDLALTHGLAGLLYERIREAKAESLQDGSWSALRGAYLGTAVENAARLETLREVEHRLARAGVEHLRLKGVALLDDVYADPGLRPMSDIDLLIRQRDVGRAVSELAPLGFTPHQERELDGAPRPARRTYHAQLLRDAGGVDDLLELHWDLTQPDGLMRTVHLDIPAIFGSRRGSLPSLEDTLVILAVHLARHYFRGLIWLADVALFCRVHERAIDWERVVRLARQAGASCMLHMTLSLAGFVFGPASRIPDDVVRDTSPGPIRRAILETLFSGSRLVKTGVGPRVFKILLPDRARDCLSTASWAMRYSILYLGGTRRTDA